MTTILELNEHKHCPSRTCHSRDEASGLLVQSWFVPPSPYSFAKTCVAIFFHHHHPQQSKPALGLDNTYSIHHPLELRPLLENDVSFLDALICLSAPFRRFYAKLSHHPSTTISNIHTHARTVPCCFAWCVKKGVGIFTS